MTPGDIALRNATYRLFVSLGRSPSAEEAATASGLASSAVLEGWRRLHEEHAIVLSSGAAEIRMANPFSAAARRWWDDIVFT